MIKIKNNILPFKGYKSLCLWPFIFIRKDCIFRDVDLNHELIHGEQQKELLLIFFYIIYLIEFIFKGYRNISFELEAFTNEDVDSYLATRKHFSWIKFI